MGPSYSSQQTGGQQGSTLSLSISFSHTFFLSLSHTLSVYLSHTHSLSLAVSLSLSLSLSRTPFLTLNPGPGWGRRTAASRWAGSRGRTPTTSRWGPASRWGLARCTRCPPRSRSRSAPPSNLRLYTRTLWRYPGTKRLITGGADLQMAPYPARGQQMMASVDQFVSGGYTVNQ